MGSLKKHFPTIGLAAVGAAAGVGVAYVLQGYGAG